MAALLLSCSRRLCGVLRLRECAAAGCSGDGLPPVIWRMHRSLLVGLLLLALHSCVRCGGAATGCGKEASAVKAQAAAKWLWAFAKPVDDVKELCFCCCCC